MTQLLELETLSTVNLLEIIQLVTEELQRRAAIPKFQEPENAGAITPAFSPTPAEQAFIKNCYNKDYVLAEYKDKWKELAKRYPVWFSHHGYPSDLRGSDYKRHRDYFRRNDNE